VLAIIVFLTCECLHHAGSSSLVYRHCGKATHRKEKAKAVKPVSPAGHSSITEKVFCCCCCCVRLCQQEESNAQRNAKQSKANRTTRKAASNKHTRCTNILFEQGRRSPHRHKRRYSKKTIVPVSAIGEISGRDDTRVTSDRRGCASSPSRSATTTTKQDRKNENITRAFLRSFPQRPRRQGASRQKIAAHDFGSKSQSIVHSQSEEAQNGKSRSSSNNNIIIIHHDGIALR